MSFAPRVVKIEEAVPLQASKWLNLQLLISPEEMEDLFMQLGTFSIYAIGRVVERGAGEILHEDFLKAYREYIEALSMGDFPLASPLFSSIFTADLEALYCILIGENQQLLRIGKPVIQVQAHTLDYSPVDGKFRSMTFGQDHIPWGLQFSYPQIHQEGKEVVQTLHRKTDSNTVLFRCLQTWIRLHTIPTTFLAGGQKVNVPMRIGKACFPWINQHGQLIKKNLRVLV